MTPELGKCRCDCGWRGTFDQLLRAPNPFEIEESLSACPACKTIDQIEGVCDEPGCESGNSCGWPSPDGYRRTCFEHYKKGKQ